METLVVKVVEKTGISKKQARAILQAVFDGIIEVLKEQKILRIRGFGVFKYEPAGRLRRFYNPRKKMVESKISIAKVKFKASRRGAWE